ncbi:DUF11 domain-containing protein [Conexibacter sp. SYSU D00693]|uniref:DUF7507 domain-containing protein n=1 Tax=Conexibacter sp. SYSU D00693 TaxID=2812560 RepID=UPI00196B06D4|nr:DUF11 domain-containing protein [Conexibacter sp. SYSU D00693]
MLRRPFGRCLAPLLALALLGAAPTAASADRGFTPRFSANDTGDVTLASNALMTCPTSASGCSTVQQGTQNAVAQNNDWNMTYVDVDGDPTTFNSSRATLDLPAGATVLFAGLYYGGDWSTGTAAAPNATARNKVKLRAPGDTVPRLLTASVVDDSTLNVGRYQGFVDVTDVVSARGEGQYTVADVQAGKGADHYAGWSLVVAYRDTTQPARNLTVFDGLRTIRPSDPPTTIPVSGFKTPPAGEVRTTVGFVTWEGDLGYTGDTATLNSTRLGDAQNPSTNFFNSSLSDRGARFSAKDPDHVNQLGFDADLLRADGVLANGATSATITVTTSGDQYLPGVITFATDLYAPKVDQTKTVVDLDGGSVEQGDVLEYRIAGTNTGQDAATGVVVRDPVPAGTTYVPGSITVGGAARTDAGSDDTAERDIAGDRIVARVGSGATATAGGRLAVNGTYDVRFRVTVGDGLVAGTKLVNTVTTSFFSESLNTPLTAVSTATSTVAAPNLRIAKSHTGSLTPGGQATYRLRVSNDGTAATQGTVTVVDRLPAELTATSAAGSGWSCGVTDAGKTVTCTRADALATGAAHPDITLDVDVAADADGTVPNTATVSGGGDATPDDGSSTDPAVATPTSDLSLRKTASTATAVVGEQVTFTLTARNDGPSTARGVRVTDVLPVGLERVSATASQGSCDTAIACELGTLAPGAEATVTVVARATTAGAATTVRNTATVTGTQPDPNATNDRAAADVAVGGADLEVTKTAVGTPQAGGTASWDVTVHNAGPSPASGVVLRDVLPAQVTNASTDRGCAVEGGEVRCTVGSLAAGASYVVRVSADVAANATSLRNTASALAAERDPDTTDNTATVETPVAGEADLQVTKVADRAAAEPGGLVTFTLRVKDGGPASATGVLLRDELPAGLTFVSASAGCTAAGQTVTCAVGALATGATAERQVVARVADGAVGTLVNVARASGSQPDPVPTNDAAAAAVAVVDRADLRVTKTSDPASARPGATVAYRLAVANDGPAAAKDVVLSDPLPAGLSFVDASSGCTVDEGTVTCRLGTLAAGASREVVVTATVDAVDLPGAHQHLLGVQKVERQVDLAAGATEGFELACPQPGMVMTDGAIRVDAVDQGTGTLADVRVLRAESVDQDRYAFTVRSTAAGQAQAKAFGTCVAATTGDEGGHGHDVVLSDVAATTQTVPAGRSDVAVACGPGKVATAPGLRVASGSARVVGSEPQGTGRRFTVEADEAADVRVSVRCVDRATGTADGHFHELALREVARTVTVAAGATASEQVTCGDQEKGITASYDLPAGLLLAGHDPQPKTRVFKLVNTTAAPLEAQLDLLCLGDRTGGPAVVSQAVNTATVTTTTPDPDAADHVATATTTVLAGDVRDDAAPSTPAPQGQPSVPAPAPAAPAAAAPAPAGTAPAALTFPDATATLTLTGGQPSVRVGLRCAKAKGCKGTAKLVARKGLKGVKAGALLARGTYSVGTGKTAKVRLVLTKAGREAARSGRLRTATLVAGGRSRALRVGR